MDHNYLSTACYHLNHERCQPSRCPHCREPCICPCHDTYPAAGPRSTESVQRDQLRRLTYARALAGAEAV
jgi:hypothetical protein